MASKLFLSKPELRGSGSFFRRVNNSNVLGVSLLLACSIGVLLLCLMYVDGSTFFVNIGNEPVVLQRGLGATSLSSHESGESTGSRMTPATQIISVTRSVDQPEVESNDTSEDVELGKATGNNFVTEEEHCSGLNDGGIKFHTPVSKEHEVSATPGGKGTEDGDREVLGRCDIAHGKWVYDEMYPLYRSRNCPFLDAGFRCEENGRPDTDYMKYRWQPHDCDLPRFNAKDMLERLRNQRLVFVGDSLGRNQWESMLCMLAEGVQNKSRIYEIDGQPITKHTENVTNVLQIDRVSWSASRWPGASILVFNSGHWWSWEKIGRQGGAFQVEKNVTSHGFEEAFRIALTTWASWMEKNIDPMKTQVFFRSFASIHFRGGTWRSGGHCHEEVKPLTDEEVLTMQKIPWTNKYIEDAIHQNIKMKRSAVEYMDVTTLTNYRSDGHSGLYANNVKLMGPTPKNRQDCSHFCLPGVPDTWNELLFATLLARGQGVWGQPTGQ
ncbi:protein trichome birefringence-like 9 isoform X2 [Physcomitrium patens]|uniref:Trichome birefringence-like N-terminal domain-containing protein n=1 Tax=Physcomitrium patens TaxID=3218 RepID=A0A7I4FQX2_PHYPA